MRLPTISLLVLVGLGSFCVPKSAPAQTPSQQDVFTDMARRRFQEGVRLYDQGRYEEARAAFLQAYALKGHPTVLLNLAQSELRSDHPVDAARNFAKFLRENPQPDPGETRIAQEGLAIASKQTGRIDARVDVAGAEVFIDGVSVGSAPLPEPVFVAPGRHKVEAKAPGYAAVAADSSVQIGGLVVVQIHLGRRLGTLASGGGGEGASLASSTAYDAGKKRSATRREPFLHWFFRDPVGWALGGGLMVGGLTTGGILWGVSSRRAGNADNIESQIQIKAAEDPRTFDKAHPCATSNPYYSYYAPACLKLLDERESRDSYQKAALVTALTGVGVGAVASVVGYYARTTAQPVASDAAQPHAHRWAIIAPVVAPHVQGLVLTSQF